MTSNTNSTSSSLPATTSDVAQEVRVRMGKDGQAARPTQTVVQAFDAMVKKHGNLPALHFKEATKEGQDVSKLPWKSYSWKQYREQVDRFGKALLTLDFSKFDVINIIGFNAPAWFIANFGAIAAGGVSAGIYSTNGPDACLYISKHSKAKVVVCEGVKQLEKYVGIANELPDLKALVMYGPGALSAAIKEKSPVPCYTFDDFLQVGKNVSNQDIATRSASWKPGETCTLIYTSGTTGPPKAVMITNDNITWTVDTMLHTTRRGTMDPNDVMVSYLPLSHIAAQMLDMHMPMVTGCQIYFAQPDALKGTLVQTLQAARPTTFFGVPRVWEKIYDRMQQVAKSTTGVKKMLSTWAKGKASQHWQSLETGTNASAPLFGTRIAFVLLKKVHKALGLDRCYGFYVSAAPIDEKILRYFFSLNIPIMELFGQSECTGPHAVNTYTAFRVGTVGRPMLCTETRRDPDTGELQYRGRHIFAGYMGMPDMTAETIDQDGWLHSGDVITMDKHDDGRIPKPSGFISITGRIKELIITAGGENVPPVLIEEELKNAMPALSNAMVIGDKRKFLAVLLTLKVEVDEDGTPTRKLTGEALETSQQIGSSAQTTDEAHQDAKWSDYFEGGIKAANAKATSRAQNVGKWTLLSNDFSEKGGELTPTLKLKRNVTADKYASEIEAMYA